jgi:tripartite-type tricarboxylate transporter receptor subunit TctC
MKIAKKLLAACALTLLAAAAQAQAWPAKPVTLLVPFPPGGASDMVARTLGTKLQERFNQTFMVDNRAGATGTIGAAQVKRAAPDGQTFLVTSTTPPRTSTTSRCWCRRPMCWWCRRTRRTSRSPMC